MLTTLFASFLIGAGFAVGYAVITFLVELAFSLISKWLEQRDKRTIVADVKKIADQIATNSDQMSADEFLTNCQKNGYGHVAIKQDKNTGECEEVIFSETLDSSIKNAMGNRRSLCINS